MHSLHPSSAPKSYALVSRRFDKNCFGSPAWIIFEWIWEPWADNLLWILRGGRVSEANAISAHSLIHPRPASLPKHQRIRAALPWLALLDIPDDWFSMIIRRGSLNALLWLVLLQFHIDNVGVRTSQLISNKVEQLMYQKKRKIWCNICTNEKLQLHAVSSLLI